MSISDKSRGEVVTPLMKRFRKVYATLSKADQEALERKALQIIARRNPGVGP